MENNHLSNILSYCKAKLVSNNNPHNIMILLRMLIQNSSYINICIQLTNYLDYVPNIKKIKVLLYLYLKIS